MPARLGNNIFGMFVDEVTLSGRRCLQLPDLFTPYCKFHFEFFSSWLAFQVAAGLTGEVSAESDAVCSLSKLMSRANFETEKDYHIKFVGTLERYLSKDVLGRQNVISGSSRLEVDPDWAISQFLPHLGSQALLAILVSEGRCH